MDTPLTGRLKVLLQLFQLGRKGSWDDFNNFVASLPLPDILYLYQTVWEHNIQKAAKDTLFQNVPSLDFSNLMLIVKREGKEYPIRHALFYAAKDVLERQIATMDFDSLLIHLRIEKEWPVRDILLKKLAEYINAMATERLLELFSDTGDWGILEIIINALLNRDEIREEIKIQVAAPV